MSRRCQKPPFPAMWRALSLQLPAWEVRSHLTCMATKKPLLGVIVML